MLSAKITMLQALFLVGMHEESLRSVIKNKDSYLLPTGAKLGYREGNWFVYGHAADGGDVRRIVNSARMRLLSKTHRVELKTEPMLPQAAALEESPELEDFIDFPNRGPMSRHSRDRHEWSYRRKRPPQKPRYKDHRR